MKSPIRISFLLSVLIALVSACGTPLATPATPSTDDAVNTAVAGTQQDGLYLIRYRNLSQLSANF